MVGAVEYINHNQGVLGTRKKEGRNGQDLEFKKYNPHVDLVSGWRVTAILMKNIQINLFFLIFFFCTTGHSKQLSTSLRPHISFLGNQPRKNFGVEFFDPKRRIPFFFWCRLHRDNLSM
jgi:hypothetical protein